MDDINIKICAKGSAQLEITFGTKVTYSPIGSGVLTGCNDRGYPMVNDIAVTWLITEDGTIYTLEAKPIQRVNSEDSSNAKTLGLKPNFFYFAMLEDTQDLHQFAEGTGPYKDAVYGEYYDYAIDWMIKFMDPEPITEKEKYPLAESILDLYGKELSKNNREEIKSFLIHSIHESSLLVKIGEMFGKEAYEKQGESYSEHMDFNKIPELVKKVIQERNVEKELHDDIILEIRNLTNPINMKLRKRRIDFNQRSDRIDGLCGELKHDTTALKCTLTGL